MPSFLQVVLAVCICYLIVRGFCAPNLQTVRYDLVEVAGKECAKTLDTDDDECDEFVQVSRQHGLDALEALIDKRPVARCKEDVLDFLKSFKANKLKWGVSKEDLRAMYLRRRSCGVRTTRRTCNKKFPFCSPHFTSLTVSFSFCTALQLNLKVQASKLEKTESA